MHNILITGSSGQVGKALTDLAWPADIQLLTPDRTMLDLSSKAGIAGYLNGMAVNQIINCAAYTNVDRAEDEAELADAVNAKAPGILAQYADQHDLPIIHLSTDYVFDGKKSSAYGEADDVNPINVYGRTKLAGEQAVVDSGARAVILRAAWIISAHGNNFLKTMLRLGAERETLSVVDDQLGTPTSAASLARAIQAIALDFHRNDGGETGIYHFSNRGAVTWHGLAHHIFAAAGRYGYEAPKLTPISAADFPSKSQRPANSRLCTDKVERIFDLDIGPWQDEVDIIIDTLLGSSS